MEIANRDGIAARKEGSGKKGSRIGRFQAKRMKAVVEKQSKGKPLQQHEGRWRLARNFSRWSEVASEKFRVGDGERARGSQLGKREELLTKLGMKDGWIGRAQIEGKTATPRRE